MPKGAVFAVTQSVLAFSSSSISADTATMAAGATATVVDAPTGRIELKIPHLGIDQTITINAGPVKLSNGEWINIVPSGDGLPALNYAQAGQWEIFDSTETKTVELGEYVAGYQTPVGGMPTTGSATYYNANGVQGAAYYLKPENGLPYSVRHLQGAVNLTVDFGKSTLTGAFTNMLAVGGDAGLQAWNTIQVSGSLSGTSLSGTTTALNSGASSAAFGTGTGTIRGNFYGPVADEMAGIWTLSDGTNSAIGTFGAQTSTSAPPIVLPATIGPAEAATVGSNPPTNAAGGFEQASTGGPSFSRDGPSAHPAGRRVRPYRIDAEDHRRRHHRGHHR